MRLITLVLLFVFMFSAVANLAFGSVLSFKEWKSEKVTLANNRVITQKSKVARLKLEGDLVTAQTLEKELDQDRWNLDIANELTVTDYFVLYLSKSAQPYRFQEAASKLSPTEMAEIMEGYAKALGSAPFDQKGDKLPSTAVLDSRAR